MRAARKRWWSYGLEGVLAEFAQITMSLPLPSPLTHLSTANSYYDASFRAGRLVSVIAAGTTARVTVHLPAPAHLWCGRR